MYNKSSLDRVGNDRMHGVGTFKASVGDPYPQDPHVFGPLGSGTGMDPDPSLFS